jgi:hypothetical protein
VRAAIFAALLGSYVGLQSGIKYVVNQFGDMESSSQKVISMFVARWEAFNSKAGVQKENEGATEEDPSTVEQIGQVLSYLTPTNIFNLFFNLITYISFLLVMAAIYILQKVQVFILAVAYGWGPICLGFAALHPFFNVLALSWFWTFVEVAAWGVSMEILLRTIAGIDSVIAEKMLSTYDSSEVVMTYADNFFVNVVYIFMVFSVPAVTSMMIRSHSAASIGARALSVVGGGMASAAGTAGLAMASVGGSAGKGLGSIAGKLLGRSGGKDEGSGSKESSSSGGTTPSRKGD